MQPDSRASRRLRRVSTTSRTLSGVCCQSSAGMRIPLEEGRDQAHRSRCGLLMPRERISITKRVARQQKSSEGSSTRCRPRDQLLFSTIRNFNLLEKNTTVVMSIFVVWFAANNPDIIKANMDNEFARQIKILREKCTDLNSKKVFYLIYEGLKKHAPYLFPENPL